MKEPDARILQIRQQDGVTQKLPGCPEPQDSTSTKHHKVYFLAFWQRWEIDEEEYNVNLKLFLSNLVTLAKDILVLYLHG